MLSHFERTMMMMMMLERKAIGWICSSRGRTEAGSLSCPAVCLADCYGACHCEQQGVQPLHGVQRGNGINHWNTHSPAYSLPGKANTSL